MVHSDSGSEGVHETPQNSSKRRRYLFRSDTPYQETSQRALIETEQNKLQQAFRDLENKNGGIFGRPSESKLSDAAALGEDIKDSLSIIKDREMLEAIVIKIREKLSENLKGLEEEPQGEINNKKITAINEDIRLYDKYLVANQNVQDAETNFLSRGLRYSESLYAQELRHGIKKLADERRLSLSQTIQDALDDCRNEGLQKVVTGYRHKKQEQLEIREKCVKNGEKLDIENIKDIQTEGFTSSKRSIAALSRKYNDKYKQKYFMQELTIHISHLENGIKFGNSKLFTESSKWLAEGQASLDILRTINATRQDSTTKLYQLLKADSQLWEDVGKVYTKLKEIGIPIDTDQGESST